jgi:hypothetical protein
MIYLYHGYEVYVDVEKLPGTSSQRHGMRPTLLDMKTAIDANDRDFHTLIHERVSSWRPTEYEPVLAAVFAAALSGYTDGISWGLRKIERNKAY